MEDLKIRVFRTIEKEIELQDFEKWLYVQNDLSERMDEGLILELFSFNYNQRGASFGKLDWHGPIDSQNQTIIGNGGSYAIEREDCHCRTQFEKRD